MKNIGRSASNGKPSYLQPDMLLGSGWRMITKPEVFVVRLSHKQGLVEHGSVDHRVGLVQLGNHLVEPPHTVPGYGADTGQVVLVTRNILPVSPCDGIEALLDLGSNGQEYRHRDQIDQAGKHPLLLLKLLDFLPVKHSIEITSIKHGSLAYLRVVVFIR